MFAVADLMFARKHPEAQIDGQLKRIANEPHWKLKLRRIVASHPATADFFLAPACSLGERFIHVPALRRLGVRALQMRRGIHWLHKVLEIDKDILDRGTGKKVVRMHRARAILCLSPPRVNVPDDHLENSFSSFPITSSKANSQGARRTPKRSKSFSFERTELCGRMACTG